MKIKKRRRNRRNISILSISAIILALVASLVFIFVYGQENTDKQREDFIKKVFSVKPVESTVTADDKVFDTLTEDQKYYYRMGLIIAKYPKDKTIALKGNHITIYAEELWKIKEYLILGGKSEKQAQEQALNEAISTQALYLYAVENGYSAEEKEVMEKISANRKNIHQSPKYTGFTLMLEAAGITEDDYWAMQFESTKKSIVYTKMLNALKTEAMGQKSLSENDAQKYVDLSLKPKIINNYIKKDGISYYVE